MGFAHRRMFDPVAYVRETSIIGASFGPNGTGAVLNTTGLGLTVARAGVGDFTLTLDDMWPELVSARAWLQLASAGDKYAQVGSYVAASKTVKVYTWDISADALADIAANDNNRVNIELIFKNTKGQR